MLGELVEADVAGVNGHGLRVGGEGQNARAVIKFDDAHFDFISKTGGVTFGIKARQLLRGFAVRDDEASDVEKVEDAFAEVHVFESAGVIFGDEEVIALFEAKPFADIFKSVGEGPTNANGLFGECKGGFAQGVQSVFSVNPVDLVRHEDGGQRGVGVDGEERKEHKAKG